MVTVASSDHSCSGVKLDYLSIIDIGELSQSELHALSLCSDSSFDLQRSDDVIIPNIDRSVFNESAGSRRQTYARSRLHPRSRHSISSPPPSDDPEDDLIIHSLKKLIDPNDSSSLPLLKPVVLGHANVAHEMAIVLHSGERKRKRGRKSAAKKLQDNDFGVELEMVNENGVPVDLQALVDADNLYNAALSGRTIGLETEEDTLGFLRDLEGQWGSRRKKRKIVNAIEFGDSLPIGWKILLGLKRREGHVSIYCRRYISPLGQQFISCKEVAAFLQSYFAGDDRNWPTSQRNAGIKKGNGEVCTSHAGFPHSPNATKQSIIYNSIVEIPPLADAHDEEISLMDIENLAEVQVRDIFECYKCNVSFDERNSYLQHLLYHQKTSKSIGLDVPVGVEEGVIITDGKYECQFCDKVFLERRSYNDHVGIHAKDCFRDSDDLFATPVVHETSGSSLQDGL